MWHGASWNFILWGLYYAVLLLIEKHRLLAVFKKMPKAVSFILTKVYVILITVFGFAIFYFDKNLLGNLAPMFGIGASGFTGIVTNSVICDNLYLLIAACVLAVPVVPFLGKLCKEKLHVPYEGERIFKTLCAVAILLVATVRLCGNTYSAFLYFRF